jgi:exonuclease SbcD
MGKLRQVYPNVLEIKRPAVTPAGERRGAPIDHRKMTELELFTGFYNEVTGEPLSEEQRRAFIGVTRLLMKETREAGT